MVDLLPAKGRKEISELYGYPARDQSDEAKAARGSDHCPIIGATCTKVDHANNPTGACSVQNPGLGETIICPNRLYFNGYQVLQEAAEHAFGPGCRIVHPSELHSTAHDGKNVVAFGKRYGSEIRVPLPRQKGERARFFYTDWVLALMSEGGTLEEYVGVEVQSIDTTGNYRDNRAGFMRGEDMPPPSGHGLNWENVNKRILPQIIFKGRVLQREELCRRGLYFIMPENVFLKVLTRLGGALEEYPPGRGAVTFFRYALEQSASPGVVREVSRAGVLTTTIEVIAERFSGFRDLPEPGQFEQQIRNALASP